MNDIFLTDQQKLNKQDKLREFIGDCYDLRQEIPEYEIMSLNHLTIWFDKRNNLFFEKPQEYKRVMSFILGGSANGHKCKLLAVLKEGQRLNGRLPPNLVATKTSSGLLNSAVTSMYLSHVLRPYLEEFQHGETGALFIDNYAGFRNENFTNTCEEIMIDPFFYPHNCQEELNPSKVWLNEFKDCLQYAWDIFALEGRHGKRGFLLWPGYNKILSIVSSAWNSVRENTIRLSFRACAITSSDIDEFNPFLRSSLLWVPTSQTNTSGSPFVSDFSLTSSQDSNPNIGDGVFYRDQQNELRVILAIGPQRSARERMCLRNRLNL